MTLEEPNPLKHETRKQRFYREIWPEAAMLMRTAISMTATPGDTAEAEDLVQDTLLKAFNALDQLKADSHPKAWLLTMLRRTWIDRWRKQSRSPERQAVDLDHAPEPEAAQHVGQYDAQWDQPEDLMQRLGDQEIIDAMRLLPQGYRWALLLVDVQSLSMEEAAEVLGVATGTVKSRLHRGRAMLRDRLFRFAQDRGWDLARMQPSVKKKA